MDFFKKSITMALGRLSFLRNQNEGVAEITPFRDWFTIVIMTGVVGAIFISVASYLFIVINSDERVKIETAGIGVFESVNKEQLGEALQLFSQKKDVYGKLFETPPNIIDPSL